MVRVFEESLFSFPSFSTTVANSNLDGGFYFHKGENDDGISLDIVMSAMMMLQLL